jgi:hypothetical protein
MRARSSSSPLAAAAASLALLVGGCRTTEVTKWVPGGTDGMGRPVQPLAPDHGWSWNLEAGAIPGPLSGSSERLGAGLRVAIRPSSGLSGKATTFAVEEYRPSGIPVGTVRWPRGALGYVSPASSPTDDVLVEWMVGLRERGSCAVEIDLVPRLTPSCGEPTFLESFRVRRTVSLGDSIVFAADPAARSSADAGLLVGAPAGRAGRFVIRVRD